MPTRLHCPAATSPAGRSALRHTAVLRASRGVRRCSPRTIVVVADRRPTFCAPSRFRPGSVGNLAPAGSRRGASHRRRLQTTTRPSPHAVRRVASDRIVCVPIRRRSPARSAFESDPLRPGAPPRRRRQPPLCRPPTALTVARDDHRHTRSAAPRPTVPLSVRSTIAGRPAGRPASPAVLVIAAGPKDDLGAAAARRSPAAAAPAVDDGRRRVGHRRACRIALRLPGPPVPLSTADRRPICALPSPPPVGRRPRCGAVPGAGRRPPLRRTPRVAGSEPAIAALTAPRRLAAADRRVRVCPSPTRHPLRTSRCAERQRPRPASCAPAAGAIRSPRATRLVSPLRSSTDTSSRPPRRGARQRFRPALDHRYVAAAPLTPAPAKSGRVPSRAVRRPRRSRRRRRPRWPPAPCGGAVCDIWATPSVPPLTRSGRSVRLPLLR